jgi:hypothetical protein
MKSKNVDNRGAEDEEGDELQSGYVLHQVVQVTKALGKRTHGISGQAQRLKIGNIWPE